MRPGTLVPPLELDAPALRGSTLAELPRLLAQEKARAALRLVLAGRALARESFVSSGHALTHEEFGRVRAFEERGLSSRVTERVASADGSARLVVRLADGESVETVAMPSRAVCVSTQVGCAVGCRFCASGLLGLKRNLLPGEILEQVAHARREMRIDRVLYMGMGEPAHNLAHVLDAVAALKHHGWISPHKQTFSTIGSRRALEELSAARVKPCLALSLHAADDELRRSLVPRAGDERIAELLALAESYGRAQGKPILLEWTLLAGVNDRDTDADALAGLVQGMRACVNFIRWNPVEGLPFAPSSFERAVAMRERVKSRGVLATIRASTGADVDAACGQLRRRATGAAGR